MKNLTWIIDKDMALLLPIGLDFYKLVNAPNSACTLSRTLIIVLEIFFFHEKKNIFSPKHIRILYCPYLKCNYNVITDAPCTCVFISTILFQARTWRRPVTSWRRAVSPSPWQRASTSVPGRPLLSYLERRY